MNATFASHKTLAASDIKALPQILLSTYEISGYGSSLLDELHSRSRHCEGEHWVLLDDLLEVADFESCQRLQVLRARKEITFTSQASFGAIV